MTLKVAIPASVADSVRNRWPDTGERWCTEVLSEFDALCTQYHAIPIRVLPARFAFVVSVETATGHVVFRSTPDPAGLAQAAVSQAIAERGIGPDLLDVFATETGTWTVTEKVVPGTSLADADQSDVNPDAVANLFRRLAEQPAPAVNMARIDGWLRRRLVDSGAVDFPVGQAAAPEHERYEAMAALDSLVATGDTGQLCHGDGYPGNVLLSGDGRLLWIDPRGVAGDASYDVAVFALKTARHVVSDAVPMAARLAEKAGINADRARAWVAVANAARV